MSYICYHQHEPCIGGGKTGTCKECYKIMDEISCYGQTKENYYKENGLCQEYEESPEGYAYHILYMFDNNRKHVITYLEKIIFILENHGNEKSKESLEYYLKIYEEIKKFPTYFDGKTINELNIRIQEKINIHEKEKKEKS